jgi:glycosyltransferase involved in cell wall biosynthesis
MLVPKLEVGGAEIQVVDLLKHLDKSRVSVSLCCLTFGSARMEREACRYVDSLFILEFRWRGFPLAFSRLVRYFRHGRFEVVHCHMPPADSIGRLGGWIAGVPVRVTTEHGRNLWKSWAYLLFERILNSITDLKFCVSRDIMEIRARREKTPPRKLKHAPNAVDPATFRAPGRQKAAVMAEFGWEPDDLLVVSVGRLAPEKNYGVLVESLAIIRDGLPGVRCLLAGDGICREEIAEAIEARGLKSDFKLAGSREDIPDLLHAADVFVLSSLKEGLPVSLIEAMAAGKAVVATRVGGIPDAIDDGKNGMLVPSDDPGALAGAIEKLLRNGDLRVSLGKAASKTVDQRFNIGQLAEQTVATYLDLLKKKTKRGKSK